MTKPTLGLREQLAQCKHELQASEARFRNVIVRNADGILIVDRVGVVRFMNQAAETLLGRKAEELREFLFGFPLVDGETTEVDILRRQGEISIAEMRVVTTDWEGASASLVLLH